MCSLSPKNQQERTGIGESAMNIHQIVGYHKNATKTCLDSVGNTEHLRLRISFFCR